MCCPVERRLNDVKALAALAATRTQRRAKLSLTSHEKASTSADENTESLGALFDKKDPAAESSVLTLLTVFQQSQDTAGADRRSAALMLPSDAIATAVNPNVRNPMEIATRYFLISLLNPTWTRYTKATQDDWKKQAETLKAARQTLQSDGEMPIPPHLLLLELMRSRDAQWAHQTGL